MRLTKDKTVVGLKWEPWGWLLVEAEDGWIYKWRQIYSVRFLENKHNQPHSALFNKSEGRNNGKCDDEINK